MTEEPATAAGRRQPGGELGRWLQEAASELGIEPAQVDVDLVLDLARDVAHGVARPAAPLTAYLAGVAAGRLAPAGAGAAEDLLAATARAVQQVQRLVRDWPQATSDVHRKGS